MGFRLQGEKERKARIREGEKRRDLVSTREVKDVKTERANLNKFHGLIERGEGSSLLLGKCSGEKGGGEGYSKDEVVWNTVRKKRKGLRRQVTTIPLKGRRRAYVGE